MPRMTPDQQAEFDGWFAEAYPRVVSRVKEWRNPKPRPTPKPIEFTRHYLVVRDHVGALRRIPLTDTFSLNYRKAYGIGISNLRFDVAAIVWRKSSDPFGDDERSVCFDRASATVEIDSGIVADSTLPGLHPFGGHPFGGRPW